MKNSVPVLIALAGIIDFIVYFILASTVDNVFIATASVLMGSISFCAMFAYSALYFRK